MLSILAVFGCLAVFMTPVLCTCLSSEYLTMAGQCCPMCQEGTVVRRHCTSQSPTRCSTCINGTFMNQPNGLYTCFSCTSCEQGTDRTDTECERCQEGYFSVDGQNCTAWTICSETQVKVQEGSSSSDVVCKNASRRRFFYIPVIITALLSLALMISGILVKHRKKSRKAGCLAVFMTPVLCVCPPKQYRPRAGQCCPMCHEGTVIERDCTSKSPTRCSNCINGTFMNQRNGRYTCFSCTSCDQGLFIRQQCTTTADTVCDVLSGYFCKAWKDDAGCSSAQKHTRCPPGQRIKVPGTDRTDTECERCQEGYFSVDGQNCTAWTTCSETQVKVQEGSSSSDVVCKNASRQHFFYISLIITALLLSLMISVKLRKMLRKAVWHTVKPSPG